MLEVVSSEAATYSASLWTPNQSQKHCTFLQPCINAGVFAEDGKSIPRTRLREPAGRRSISAISLLQASLPGEFDARVSNKRKGRRATDEIFICTHSLAGSQLLEMNCWHVVVGSGPRTCSCHSRKSGNQGRTDDVRTEGLEVISEDIDSLRGETATTLRCFLHSSSSMTLLLVESSDSDRRE